MVGTKFLVQWEEHPTHLATRLGYLLEHQSLVDVTLMCNTHTLKVHRSVLAACSPYFESVLQRQLGNQPLIVLKDMKFSVLKSLVEFMYCGETSVTEENLSPLMEAAKFFEVKGLSSMTKEAIGERSTTPLQQSPVSSSTMNGITPSGRGGRRPGAGRGRRPSAVPVAGQAPFPNPPTESAQILLSLSGTPGQSTQNANRNVRFNQNNRIGKVLNQDNNLVEGAKPYIRNGSLGNNDVNTRPVRGGYEPRRRGRRRNPASIGYNRNNLAYKESEASRIAVENLQKEMDGQCDQKDSKLSLWNTNAVDKAPLLASLLSKSESYGSKIKTENDDSNPCENSVMNDNETMVYQVDNETIQGSNMKYLEALKEAGLPTDVPILIDNGDGNYITLTEDVLMNVMEGKDEFQFHVTEGTLEGNEVGEGVVLQDGSVVMERKKNSESTMAVTPYASDKKEGVRQFVVKEMQATKSDEEDLATVLSESVKKDDTIKDNGKMSIQDIINEAVLETLKSDSKETDVDPDAVVLFEVTENSKVEKYVVSSKEVNVLKALNEQLVQRKKHLQDVKKTPLSPVGVIGGNTKIAEVKLTIGKSKSTKSLLSQVIECAQETLKQSSKKVELEKKDVVKGQSQLVELEFIDGNGEKIEGYQVEGTVVSDKPFEEMNNVEGSNDDISTNKDDDVMNLLTLDSETDRIINNNTDHESELCLVEAAASDTDKEHTSLTIVKNDELDDSYVSDTGMSIEKEANLCIENTEHLDVNKVQNLDVNEQVQNLDDKQVQNVVDNVIENEEDRPVLEPQISLTVENCDKEISVEEALEEMMGVGDSILMKSDSKIEITESDSDCVTGAEQDNCDIREDKTVPNDSAIEVNTNSDGIEGNSDQHISEIEEINVIAEKDNSIDLIDNSLIIESSESVHVEPEINHTDLIDSELRDTADCSEDLSLIMASDSEHYSSNSSTVQVAVEHVEESVVSSNTFQEYLSDKGFNSELNEHNDEEVIDEPTEKLLSTLEVDEQVNEDKNSSHLLPEVLNSLDVSESAGGKDDVSSPTKDVPFAVGLLPLKTALEKIQTIPEHQPRKTRSSSTSREECSAPKRRSSTCNSPQEPVDKKIKLNEVNDDTCDLSDQIEPPLDEVQLADISS